MPHGLKNLIEIFIIFEIVANLNSSEIHEGIRYLLLIYYIIFFFSFLIVYLFFDIVCVVEFFKYIYISIYPANCSFLVSFFFSSELAHASL